MKKVDSYDLVEILSTMERDFLVRSNGDQVKIESLRGKSIGMYFPTLRKEYEDPNRTMALVEVYNELSPKGEFEVVFAAAIEDRGEDEELFNKIFSKMPWLSIPFFDLETRNHLRKFFSGPSCWASDCVILNPNGKILWDWGSFLLHDYGAECYPFTLQRIQEIKEEDKTIRENMSLKSLLATLTCDYVITNEENKVPISELEGKVVGLFMCGEHKIMPKLVEIYDKLKEMGENFEIVFINSHFYNGYSDEISFEQNFKRMPWLGLPFLDKRCRKLWRIFEQPGIEGNDEGILVIIGSGGNFVEYYGASIVEEYGIEAYPFTQQKAVEIEKERLKAVTLESLFVAANKDFVIQSDGAKIPVSDLKGKNIVLFFASQRWNDYCKVVPKLIEWYKEIKERDETFEVIFVSSDICQTSFDEFFSKMPWLAFPYDAHLRPLFYELLNCTFAELIAFGSDGHLLTKEASRHLQILGADAYPFTDEKLSKEIHEELAIRHSWIIIDENGNRYRP